MKKFITSTLIVLAVIFYSTFVFAANDGNNLGDQINSTMEKASNTVSSWGSDIKNNMDMNNNNNNTLDNNTNGITNTNATNNTGTNTGTTTGNYTATRTAGNMTNGTSNRWTWVVLGVTAIVIVGLIWYYAAQQNSKNNSMNDEY